ncbi:MAG: Na+/H+ antiporter subunit D [Phycisphaerales bacterium]|nr:MAG: Na+/H+ antiporter subunit D [Phycisphaerales bacterium]
MDLLVASPILLHLTAGLLCVVAWKSVPAQRVISIVAALLGPLVAGLLLVTVHNSGPQTAALAGWPAPYGIVLVGDAVSVIMVALVAVVGLAVVVYAMGALDKPRERAGYHPLIHLLLTAVNGAFLSGDVFNMYVWFEVMLLASFVLITLGGTRGQLEGAIKYVTLNLLSSVLFLSAIGLLYGIVGTLNLADIAVKLPLVDAPGLKAVIAMLFLVAFGIKAALFPFFFWLPASYHTPPPAIIAVFAGVLTKVGIYSILRVFTLCFPQQLAEFADVFVWIAGFTMVVGVLGAAAQFEMRRILAFHSVSQVGYMFMGIAIAGVCLAQLAIDPAGDEQTGVLRQAAVVAVAGTMIFMLHHGVVKMNLFFISGIVMKLRGTAELKHLGDLYRTHPMLSLLFMVTAMSLAGIPVLSGFWAKLVLVRAGLDAGAWWLVGAALFVGSLTLFSMVKIWAEAFWKTTPADADKALAAHDESQGGPVPGVEPRAGQGANLTLMTIPAAALTVLAVAMGVGIAPIYRAAERAGEAVMNPDQYIEAVLDAEYLERLDEHRAALGLPPRRGGATVVAEADPTPSPEDPS